MIESDASRQSALREQAELRNGELIELSRVITDEPMDLLQEATKVDERNG